MRTKGRSRSEGEINEERKKISCKIEGKRIPGKERQENGEK